MNRLDKIKMAHARLQLKQARKAVAVCTETAPIGNRVSSAWFDRLCDQCGIEYNYHDPEWVAKGCSKNVCSRECRDVARKIMDTRSNLEIDRAKIKKKLGVAPRPALVARWVAEMRPAMMRDCWFTVASLSKLLGMGAAHLRGRLSSMLRAGVVERRQLTIQSAVEWRLKP